MTDDIHALGRDPTDPLTGARADADYGGEPMKLATLVEIPQFNLRPPTPLLVTVASR